jgi:hypothetical protein
MAEQDGGIEGSVGYSLIADALRANAVCRMYDYKICFSLNIFCL